MFNTETGEAPSQSYHPSAKTGKADLSQLLQKEKMYGQAAHDWAPDMAHFRGFFVYIHDMDEQTRPVMLRDYPKPATRDQGKWPQLRVNAAGRCPFLDDPSAKQPVPRPEQAPRTRAAAAREAPPLSRALSETTANLARRARTASLQPEDQVKPLDPPKSIPLKRGSTDNLPLYGSAQASLRRHPRFAGGEPVASGLQASNVTSAIRSQMISSTAAVPGTKVGASKELHRLGRRVLERSAMPATDKMPSYNDVRAAINNDPVAAPVATKRKVDDALEHIQEEELDVSDEEERPQRVVAPRKKKAATKDLKPGYCENCRAKFDDFDEVCAPTHSIWNKINIASQHVVSKSHRKFATTDENWRELDQLLDQLVRPCKDDIE
jgi:regulatory subunit for Cdc7p protein kinase